MEKIQSDFKFEELKVGKIIIDGFTKQENKIINLTSNSVQVEIKAATDKGRSYFNIVLF